MTTHPDAGTLQAYLDGELRPDERASLSEHLEECSACRRALRELEMLAGAVGRALPLLGAAAPELDRARWAVRARRAERARAERLRVERAGAERRRRVAAAASIVLLLGAGAAWAVPGSPLRSWWEGLRAGEPMATSLATEVAEVEPAPVLVQDDPVGVGVPLVFDRVDVYFEAVPEGAVLEVRIVDGERAWVEAPEGTSFEVEAATGTARAFVGSGSGRIRVELPRRATGSSVRVNGATLYPPASPAEASDGVFLIPVPGGPSDGAPGGDPGTGPGGGG